MTFSAIGRCPRTGQIGGALATTSVNAGRVSPLWQGLLPTYQPNAALVMSHAFANPQLAPEVFDMLNHAYSLKQIAAELPKKDNLFEYRQVHVLKPSGELWVTTGDLCKQHASHVVGDQWATSGNGLAGREVVEAMAEAMDNSVAEDLGERLLLALEAGRDAGGQRDPITGEKRPELSSVVFVVDGSSAYPKVDLRVDYHPHAVDHMRRLYDYTRPLDWYFEGLRLHPRDLDDFLESHGVKKMAHFDFAKSHYLDTVEP